MPIDPPTASSGADPDATDATDACHWRFGNHVFQPGLRVLLCRGKPVAIGARALDLLLALVQRRDRIASRNELIETVWPGLVVEENNLSVQITTLRKLLGATAIATIPGRGYRLTVPLQAVSFGATERGAPEAARTVVPAPLPPPPERAAAVPAAAATRSNLPPVPLDLLGRADVRDALASALQQHALTTLLGAGGMGKTVLALCAAHDRRGVERDGVWWVDLAHLADGSTPDALARAVAVAIGLPLGAGQPAPQALAEGLRPLSCLVLLDNAEHVAAATARLLAPLLAAAPQVRWLVTSQTPLKLPAEQILPIGALSVPPRGATLADAVQHGALALLNRRARQANARFAVSDETLPAAIRICARLDGMPLALEMAAARLPWLGADALDERLAQSLRVLAPSGPTAPSRHQTLLTMFDWSHAVLSPVEQRVLRQLGVFVGGFTLQTAQQVAAPVALDEWEWLDALAGLVDKSWVQVDDGDPPRYRLLESARQFALERLRDADEAEAARGRHAEAMAELGDRHSDVQWNQPHPLYLRRYVVEVDNLGAAFDWALSQPLPELAARIFLALSFTLRGARMPELDHRVQALQAHAGLLPAGLQARVLIAQAICVGLRHQARSLEAGQRALALCEERAAPRQLRHYVLVVLSQLHSSAGQDAAGASFADRARSLIPPGDVPWPPFLHMQQQLADFSVHLNAGRHPEAMHHLQAALERCESMASEVAVAMMQANRMALWNLMGRYEETVRDAATVLPLLRGPGQLGARVVALINVLDACNQTGDDAAGRAAMMEALPLSRRVGYRRALLLGVLDHCLRGGQDRIAAQVLGHLDAWLAARSESLSERDRLAREAASKALHASLPVADLQRAMAEGAAWDDEQIEARLRSIEPRRTRGSVGRRARA